MKLKSLIKYLAPVLIMGAYTASVSAQSYECPQALFAYGDEFPIQKLGAKVTVKKEKEVQQMGGAAGEVMISTAYSAGESWINTMGCDTCDPKERRSGSYIVVSESLPCGLQKGMTEQQVTQIIGKPNGRQGDEFLIYNTSIEGTDDVIIHMLNGRLEGLMNSYYGH